MSIDDFAFLPYLSVILNYEVLLFLRKHTIVVNNSKES